MPIVVPSFKDVVWFLVLFGMRLFVSRRLVSLPLSYSEFGWFRQLVQMPWVAVFLLPVRLGVCHPLVVAVGRVVAEPPPTFTLIGRVVPGLRPAGRPRLMLRVVTARGLRPERERVPSRLVG